MTRACDLPWLRLSVDTSTQPPRAAPCRHHRFDDARDLAQLDLRLRRLRQELLTGSLRGPCVTCPDKELVPVRGLHDLLAAGHLDGFDGNRMLEAITQVANSALVAPPPDLTYRVAHTRDPADFLTSGLITLFDFLPWVERYDRAVRRRVLDWGCGSGRLAIHLADRHPDLDLTGCDIDAEAVQWCRDFIDGDFQVIDPLPPTGFERHSFTTVLGFSVITHLGREHQFAWIEELHDLLADDGIAVITAMGDTAARAHGLEDRLAAEGIVDDLLDPTLDPVAPQGYYRSTFQSRSWTERAWGRHFDVLEYLDAGAFSYQDIVVLRRK